MATVKYYYKLLAAGMELSPVIVVSIRSVTGRLETPGTCLRGKGGVL